MFRKYGSTIECSETVLPFLPMLLANYRLSPHHPLLSVILSWTGSDTQGSCRAILCGLTGKSYVPSEEPKTTQKPRLRTVYKQGFSMRTRIPDLSESNMDHSKSRFKLTSSPPVSSIRAFFSIKSIANPRNKVERVRS